MNNSCPSSVYSIPGSRVIASNSKNPVILLCFSSNNISNAKKPSTKNFLKYDHAPLFLSQPSAE